VIGADTLCYRDWTALARTTAHEMARSLGLQRTIEPDGYGDTLDTDASDDNLMFYSELGGDELTEEQQALLKRSPALQ
jgi:hypothetical protein